MTSAQFDILPDDTEDGSRQVSLRLVFYHKLKLVASHLACGPMELCTQEIENCHCILQRVQEHWQGDCGKEWMLQRLKLWLLELELSMTQSQWDRAMVLRTRLLEARDSLGSLTSYFGHLCLEIGRRIEEPTEVKLWLRTVLQLGMEEIDSEVRDDCLRLLLPTEEETEQRQALVSLFSSPGERQLVSLQICGSLAPQENLTHPELLRLLAVGVKSPNTEIRTEVIRRIIQQCTDNLGGKLQPEEREDLLATLVYYVREKRTEAYKATCSYAALLAAQSDSGSRGLSMVLEVGGSIVHTLLDEEGQEVELEQWLDMLIFLAFNKATFSQQFSQLAEISILELLRKREISAAVKRVSLWSKSTVLPPRLEMIVHFAAGNCQEAMLSLQQMCEGEESKQCIIKLIFQLLGTGNVDKETIRQLLLGIKEKGFFGSIQLVEISCRLAVMLEQTNLILMFLESDCVKRLVIKEDTESFISKLCWHTGLRAVGSDPRLQHGLLFLSGELLPSTDRAALPVRLASVPAGLVVITNKMDEEIVQKMRNTLNWVESKGLNTRLERTVLLYRLHLALLCGDECEPVIPRMVSLEDRVGLEAAALLAIRTSRFHGEKVAVSALLAASQLEEKHQEKDVLVAAAVEVMARQPALWDTRVGEVVTHNRWEEGQGVKFAVTQVWNCLVRLGSHHTGWAQALVFLHNSVTDPTDQIRCELGKVMVSRPLLEKIRRLLDKF